MDQGRGHAVKNGEIGVSPFCFSCVYYSTRSWHIVLMFPHFSLQRRPIYTYRRKTKPEFISDSSDDDSDLDDQKQQQRHTMVKVHEEGVSPFSGQTGAIEDKSFHIKSATTTKKDTSDQKQPGEDNADEHVTPTVTMVNWVQMPIRIIVNDLFSFTHTRKTQLYHPLLHL